MMAKTRKSRTSWGKEEDMIAVGKTAQPLVMGKQEKGKEGICMNALARRLVVYKYDCGRGFSEQRDVDNNTDRGVSWHPCSNLSAGLVMIVPLLAYDDRFIS